MEEGEPDPEGTEVSYPLKLNVTLLNDDLSVAYVDQFGREGIFRSIVDNRGNDVVLTNPDLKTKHPDSFSIVHHIKTSGDTLHRSHFRPNQVIRVAGSQDFREKLIRFFSLN